jgi:hypothetical protein
LKQYEGEFRFADRDYYDRHLTFDHVATIQQADQRQRFEAMAMELRLRFGLVNSRTGDSNPWLASGGRCPKSRR